MIPTQKLLYKLDMRLNKMVSNEHQEIPLENKILALNEAQIKLIKKKLNSNNIYNEGLDSFKKRYEDLQNLVYPDLSTNYQFEKMKVVKTLDKAYDTYQADITTLTKPYFIPLDMYCLCTKKSCKERAVALTRVAKHGDISTWMVNSYYRPSFEYEESFYVISGDNIIVFTDGTFSVDSLWITYLRYPQKIDYEGYIDFDGKASTTQNCELVDYLEDELLDLAMLELAIETENTPQVQMYQLREKNNE